jgi:hypothetical protein
MRTPVCIAALLFAALPCCSQTTLKELSPGDARALTSDHKDIFEGVKARCNPNQKVVPDMTNSDLNPFPPSIPAIEMRLPCFA